MSWTVAVDQAQLNAAQDLLKYIGGGYERAVMRAANYAADRTRTATSKKLKALLTADPERIDKSLKRDRATLSSPTAVLNIMGKTIPLFRFDVSFMYPTISGGVTAKVYKSGGQPLELKHAFIAKMQSGHVGVFHREGSPRRMNKGNYEGQVKQPIIEHFGPHAARAFEKTPGVEGELMTLGADRFVSELDRQVGLLFKQEYGVDPPDDWAD